MDKKKIIIEKNMNRILKFTVDTENKLIKILAEDLPKDITDDEIQQLLNYITNNKIINKKELFKAHFLIRKNQPINFRFKNKNDLIKYIEENKNGEKKVLIKQAVENCEYDLSAKEIIEIFNSYNFSTENKKRNILEEGELKYLHTPKTNKQKTEDILNEHLRRTGGIVRTRFPPEPNGYLHIGHAKSLYLNFNYAKLHNGHCNIRFDDTNPKNEKEEYYKSIIESVKWMGYPVDDIRAASDCFEKLIEFGFILIRKGLAYCSFDTSEEIEEQRKNLKYSKYRNTTPEKNLELFQMMVDGKFKEGEIILRLKQEYNKHNPLTFDLIAFRIIDHPHSRKTMHVYPSYDFTHCLNDSLEDITHSFCSREFFSRRETYYWLIDALDLYRPVQWEFNRLNISNTVLSKRKLNMLVENKIVEGWDDPRLYTLMGLKRRGVRPSAINNFIETVGYTFTNTIVDVRKFEKVIRDDLFTSAPRHMAIIDPLLIKIENFPGERKIYLKDYDIKGEERELIVGPELYIERSDFIGCEKCYENKQCCTVPSDFYRLTFSQPVSLLNLFTIKVKEIKSDYLIVSIIDNPLNTKYIQWVNKEDAVPIRFYLYDHLFKSFNPEEHDLMDDINPNNLVVKDGFGDIRLKNKKEGEIFQLKRIGYFCKDREENRFNLTIKLKNI